MKPGRQLSPMRLKTPLSDYLVDALEKYRHANPGMSIKEALEALEIIRHSITEAWLAFEKDPVPKW